MRLRSLLFVPGDRPDRMEKALGAGADALILDLEDSVAPERKLQARDAVATFLATPRALPVFVRIDRLTGAEVDADLRMIAAGLPDGVVLPKAEGGVCVAELDRRLTMLGDSRSLILPIATETPAAVFALGTYAGSSARLCGLTWGAEDLPAATGGISREADGSFTPIYEMVRGLTLFGAHAAGVPAIETIYPALQDEAGLAAYAARGRREGFCGMMAVHPAQVPVINAAFTPSAKEIARARRIVALFESGAGVLQLDGEMLDTPHLTQARRLLSATEDRP